MMKLNSNIFILLIFLVSFGFNSCFENIPAFKALNNEMDSEDYEIISSALEWFLKDYKGGHWLTDDEHYDSTYSGSKKLELLLIPDSTDSEDISEGIIKYHQMFDSSDNSLTRSVEKLNKSKYPIEGKKITTFETIILSGEDKYLSENMGYQELYKKYPQAWGLVTFSRPVYDLKINRAVLYLHFSKNGMWGRAVYMWLSKESGKWVQYDTVDLYII